MDSQHISRLMIRVHRGKYLTFLVILFNLMISILMVPCNINGEGSSDTSIINANDHLDLEIQVDREIILDFEISVLEGQTVDVFLMGHEEYINYMSGIPFTCLDMAWNLNISEASDKIEIQREGDYRWYHLVIDNTDIGKAEPSGDDGSVRVSYRYSYKETPEAKAEPIVQCLVVLAIFAIVIILIYRFNVKKREKKIKDLQQTSSMYYQYQRFLYGKDQQMTHHDGRVTKEAPYERKPQAPPPPTR